MTEHVALVDYGVGNIKSIINALHKLGCAVTLTSDPVEILGANKIILPGVGSFPYCMAKLKAAQLDLCIKEYVQSQKPLLGICVGMQMLFDSSEEHGGAAGLGIIPGKVTHFSTLMTESARLPHIAWNTTHFHSERDVESLFRNAPNDGEYYFVHSYACVPDDANKIFSSTRYGGTDFCSSVISGSVCGVQFHPEKSGKLGLALLDKYVKSS